MDAALKIDLDRIYADWMALTHEDLEEMYAREGYGCKACDAPTSVSWWRGEGDIYCLGCKRQLWRELRVKCTQVARRGQ